MTDFEKFDPFSKFDGWYLERSESDQKSYDWRTQRKINAASLVTVKINDNQYKVVKFRFYNFKQAEVLISRKQLIALKLQAFMFVSGLRLKRKILILIEEPC